MSMVSCHLVFDGTSQITNEFYASLKRTIGEVDSRLFDWLTPTIWNDHSENADSVSSSATESASILSSSKELFNDYYKAVENKRRDLSNTPMYTDLNNVQEQFTLTGFTNPILYLLINMNRLSDPVLRNDLLEKLSVTARCFSRIIIFAVENAEDANTESGLELKDNSFIETIDKALTKSPVTDDCMVKIYLSSLGKRFNGSYTVVDSFIGDLARMLACDILPDQLGNGCVFFREQPHNARIAILTFGTGHCFFDRNNFKKFIYRDFRKKLLEQIMDNKELTAGTSQPMSRLLSPMSILERTLSGNNDISRTVLRGRQTVDHLPYLLFPDSTRVQISFTSRRSLSYGRWQKKKAFLKEVENFYQEAGAIIEQKRDRLDRQFQETIEEDKKLLKEEIADLILDSASRDQLDDKCSKLHEDIDPWYNVRKNATFDTSHHSYSQKIDHLVRKLGSGLSSFFYFVFFWMLPSVLAVLLACGYLQSPRQDSGNFVNINTVTETMNNLLHTTHITDKDVFTGGCVIVTIWFLLGLIVAYRSKCSRKTAVEEMDHYIKINIQADLCDILQQIFLRHRQNLHQLIDGTSSDPSQLSKDRIHKLYNLKESWIKPQTDFISSDNLEHYDHFYPQPNQLEKLSAFILKRGNFLVDSTQVDKTQAEDIQNRFKDQWAELVCQFLEADLSTTSEDALFASFDEKMKQFAKTLLNGELQRIDFNLLLRNDYQEDQPIHDQVIRLTKELKSDADNFYFRGKQINQAESRSQIIIFPKELSNMTLKDTDRVFENKSIFKDQCFIFVSVLLFNGEFDGYSRE